ncbi:MAG TPA: hypothetical protein V6C65_02190 [Allocoleopsis sp.]
MPKLDWTRYVIVLTLLLSSGGADVLAASLIPHQRVTFSGSTLDAIDLPKLAQHRPRKGLGGRDGGVCAVSPGLLEDENTVWSDRPLFLWQINTEGIVLQRLTVIDQEGRILWEKPLAATDQGVVYEGTALQPGQFYQWQLQWTAEGAEQSADYTFQVMPSDRRNQITTELQALNQTLQASGASAETIAQQQADYLTEQEQPLWSDALKLLYTVENPSLNTVQRIQGWLNDACGVEENT